MEKKRYYRRPSSKLIPLDTTEILAGSYGDKSLQESLTKGNINDPISPQVINGIIWVESKRQGDRIIDDSEEDW